MSTTGRGDYYEILGVPRDADQKTIKRAFRSLARKHHPDRNPEPDAEEQFKRVAEAYAVSSDPDKRAAYDRYGVQSLADTSFDDLLSGLDLGDLFGGTATPGFGAAGGLFDRLFATSTRRPARGADIEVPLAIPLATVLTGGDETVTIPRPGVCHTCAGSGAAPGTRPRHCERCHGTGTQVSATRQGNIAVQQVAPCPACNGKGAVIDQPCPECKGTGEVEHCESITLRIPPGIDEGAVLRLPGKGMPGPSGAASGDAFVIVQIADDPRFVRRGADLWRNQEITVPDAVLGTTLTVPTLEGDEKVSVPPGTQPGAVLRIAGKGLPRRGGDGRGDLAITVTVRVPEYLDDPERHLYERLREQEHQEEDPGT